jgi:hypothetical protein
MNSEKDTRSTTASDATPGMFATPQKEHDWLRQLVGEWTFESQCSGEPGKPAETFRGSETVKALGELWIIGEGRGEMPGGDTGHMRITLGFDPARDRFVGTWIGSMMTHLWIYEGRLDADGRILTLDAEGPSFTGDGTLAKYQDVIEIVDRDHRTLTSRTLGPDATWTQFMTARYVRTS